MKANNTEISNDNILYSIDLDAKEATALGFARQMNQQNLIIPDAIIYNEEEIPVVKIQEYAFNNYYWNFEVEIISIGNNILTIGKNAFNNFPVAKTLILGNSIQEIGDCAFYDLARLEGPLILPESLNSIGESAFYRCSGFTGDLIIPNSVASIGDRAFSGCHGFTGDLIIPNSITSIGDWAFSGCRGFTGDLIIPNSITSIGDRAFSGCYGFTGDLIIPNSVTSIGENAFSGCSGFTGDLIIPDSVTSIGEGAFSKCSGCDVTISNSLIEIKPNTFSDSLFRGNLKIGNKVEIIDVNAFEGGEFSGTLDIPQSVKKISERAFAYTHFNAVIFNEGLEHIGKEAFLWDMFLSGDIIIPESVNTIGALAFFNAMSLIKTITITSSDTYIGSQAFDGLQYPLKINEWVMSKGIIPPRCGTFFAFGFEAYDKPLYVPKESIALYKAADEWKLFKYIYAIEDNEISLTLDLEDLNILVGETRELTAHLYPDDLDVKLIRWESDNIEVASVDDYGLVKGISPGIANITAKYENVSATCKVTVNPVTVTGIILNVEDMTLLVGQTDKLTATVIPPNTTDQTITWSSDNEAVATVASDGTVTGVSVGVASITATCGNISATCKVTVNPVGITGIILNVEDMILLVGQTDRIIATVTPPNSTDQNITWTSDNEAVATVDVDGTVTGISMGETYITAICDNMSATCKVTVIEPNSIYGTAETPLQLLRKGDGTSCTFVTIMPISDSQLEAQDYRFIYGYDNSSKGSQVLDNTPLRYTHTSSSLYNDTSNDFWVFAYYYNRDGNLCVSYRRHLNGRIDTDFNPEVLISSFINLTEDEIIGIYTVDGRYIGKNIEALNHGVYIVKTAMSSIKIVK